MEYAAGNSKSERFFAKNNRLAMNEKKLTLAFSPCPNDTFMFDAMVNHKIDTEGFEFQTLIADIEELNSKAFQHTCDITKISFHAFLHLVEKYVLLNSGSALGENVGPLLISKKPFELSKIGELAVAIPGEYTTAAMLLKLLLPQPKRLQTLLFSDIENAVLGEKVQAGVIIHENRFTYTEKGLYKMADLGELWASQTHQQIPLGGIVIKRNLPQETQKTIDRILKRSIEFAFQNPQSSSDFVKKHAQAMDEKVRQKHIDLYVNEYSLSLGERGRNAVEYLFQLAKEKNIIQSADEIKLFTS